MQFLMAVEPQPIFIPSWKTETKYSTRVLTGNGVEERRKCTYRKECVPFPGHRPDQISRWYGKRRVEKLPGELPGTIDSITFISLQAIQFTDDMWPPGSQKFNVTEKVLRKLLGSCLKRTSVGPLYPSC
ncbi:cilia- and flagella-associated protein 107-like [Erinaceus europaeus]|uniref:Cilia- and flagella-associated protein 107-like n=1 Tax=Erinaceus europaeus TaxID=9365 RepID=A0ABM3YJ45_ERIEU|nr:cilia- and flagella-associated protein 107-like [Erinaceus europaeus]